MNSIKVLIEARGGHDGAATGGHYGDWAEVWASRPEIASVHIVREDHSYVPGRLSYHNDVVEVEIIWDEAKLSENDFILIHHRRSPNPFLNGSSCQESYELVAGKMPAWADFPSAWREWIHKVRPYAVEYLQRVAKYLKYDDLLDTIQTACRKTSKSNLIAWWRFVQNDLKKVNALTYEPEHKQTWTGVDAMPVKIAKAVKIEGFPRWKPPIPQPKYGEKWGVIIASPRFKGYINNIKEEVS